MHNTCTGIYARAQTSICVRCSYTYTFPCAGFVARPIHGKRTHKIRTRMRIGGYVKQKTNLFQSSHARKLLCLTHLHIHIVHVCIENAYMLHMECTCLILALCDNRSRQKFPAQTSHTLSKVPAYVCMYLLYMYLYVMSKHAYRYSHHLCLDMCM